MKRSTVLSSVFGLAVAGALVTLPNVSFAQTDVRPAEARPNSVQDAPRTVTPQSPARGLPPSAAGAATVQDVNPPEARSQSEQAKPTTAPPQSNAAGRPPARQTTQDTMDMRPAEGRPDSAQSTPRTVSPQTPVR